jgi:hypothetical protein
MTALMTDIELDQITDRADLWITHGDPYALQPADVAALLTEVRELRKLRAHLIELNHQSQAKLGRLGTPAADLVPAPREGSE